MPPATTDPATTPNASPELLTSRSSRTRQRAVNPRPPGTVEAIAAFLAGVLYAAVSAYWGLGGTGLLDTIGGTLEREGRAGSTSVRLLVWATVVLKLSAALLGLIAVARLRWLRRKHRRRARRAAWSVAAVLALYGGVLTASGLLVQLDLVPASRHADQMALRWHAYLWDPWFLVWGLLLTVALTRSRPSAPPQRVGRRQPPE